MAAALCIIRNPILSTDDLNRGQHCLHVSENILFAWTRELCTFCDEAQDLASRLVSSSSGLRRLMAAEISRMRGRADVPSGKELLGIRDNEFCLTCRVCGGLAASFMPGLDIIRGKRNILYGANDYWSLIPEEAAGRIFFFLKKSDLSGLDVFLRKERIFENGLKEYCGRCGRICCSLHRPCTCGDAIRV